MDSYIKSGVHIDYTTLIGAVDALKLIPETRKMPITFSHLLSLSQFIDSVVLHEQVFYETIPSLQHQPYDEVIEASKIKTLLNPGVLASHENVFMDDDFKYKSMVWAINNIKNIDSVAIEYSVFPRNTLYRSLLHGKGIEDKLNPSTLDVFDTAIKEGDKIFSDDFNKALKYIDQKKIGHMGLYVMSRLYQLNEWLAKNDGISYYPNFSRNKLIEDALLPRKRPRNYMRWAIDELNKKREEIIKEVVDKNEVDELVFQLSPIFLSCLKGAEYPCEVLEKAMQLRETLSASKIRNVHRDLSISSTIGEDRTVSLRRELRSALADFENEKNKQFELGINADMSIIGPKIGISVKKSIKENFKKSNTTFLIESLSSSLLMVNALDAVERIFGEISLDNQWILS
ncbi:MAG: hypothetical protein HGB12_04940 [Bacteroidetes bacterium]|nr:hypothetical protein [Bacteroidota bacterium]